MGEVKFAASPQIPEIIQAENLKAPMDQRLLPPPPPRPIDGFGRVAGRVVG